MRFVLSASTTLYMTVLLVLGKTVNPTRVHNGAVLRVLLSQVCARDDFILPSVSWQHCWGVMHKPLVPLGE